jgi:hypothetical protein
MYEAAPFTDDETALDAVDHWGPAEDWADWQSWTEETSRAAR